MTSLHNIYENWPMMIISYDEFIENISTDVALSVIACRLLRIWS